LHQHTAPARRSCVPRVFVCVILDKPSCPRKAGPHETDVRP